ncbi:MAG: S-adenosyl-l-methionine hydroxide adenosyltransferase family protein [Candidatus Thermoplasmatota archaeon]|nr:S-adenosyl-l-methionine hydroxide adenosyltransferase family protein [Candidatus Thermoplasmatota archaeon]
MHTVTFLSDFGLSSGYVAQMKGVVHSFSSEVNIIDISHTIPPQDVNAGAFVLKTTIPFMPTGSIHIGVVDPGVGTHRRGIVIVTNKHIFIGPDNGLFLPSARLFGLFRIYEITNESLFQHPVSATFHGRDIFSSIAGHILSGIRFESIGPEIHDYVDLSFPTPRFEENKVVGEVLFVDDFGNLITNIDGDTFLRRVSMDQKLFIHIDEKHVPAVFAKSFGFVIKNEVLVTIGSHGYVEVSVNQGRADERLFLRKGDAIDIEYFFYDIF